MLLTGLASGAVALAIYLTTVAPGIAGGDAGELVAESCHLGTAHPPGYPLFTVLNHLVMRTLPGLLHSLGLKPGAGVDGRASPAWCANTTASVMGALTVVFVAQITGLLCNRWSSTDCQGRRCIPQVLLRGVASGCAALLMAFSPLMWQYSVTAEVFALNNALLSLLGFLAVRFSLRRDLSNAAGGALISGLALCNQHTAVLYVVPLAAWVMFQLLTSRCRFHSAHPWRRLSMEIAVLTVLFLVGLVPYAYLPLAAKHAPMPGSWGDVATWSGLLHHLHRGDYGSLRLYSGRADGGGQGLFERLEIWFWNLAFVQGLGGVVPALGVIGVISLCARQGCSWFTGSRAPPLNEERSPLGSAVPAPLSGSKTLKPCGVSGSRSTKTTLDGASSLHSTRHGNKKSRGVGPTLNDNDTRQGAKAGSMASVFASWDDEGLSAPTALLSALVVYMVVFHWLSNMPLDNPLLFGVHARFWMQPNIVVFAFCGTGMYRVLDVIRWVAGQRRGPGCFRRMASRKRSRSAGEMIPPAALII